MPPPRLRALRRVLPCIVFCALVLRVMCAPVETPDVSEEPDYCSGTREYLVKMEYKWDSNMQVPEGEKEPGFSPLICASHRPSFTLWRVGELASQQVVDLLRIDNGREGVRRLLASLAQKKRQKHIHRFVNSTLPHITSPGQDNVTISVSGDANMTLISCIAAFVPSPDWFVGIDSFDTCGPNHTFISKTAKITSYDAEIDDADDSKRKPVPLKQPRPIIVKPGLGENLGDLAITFEPRTKSSAEPSEKNSSNTFNHADCFPAHSMVETESGEQIEMRTLETTQRIRVGPNAFSEVFMFSHSDAHAQSRFLKLGFFDASLNSSGALTVSAGHYVHIFTTPGSASSPFQRQQLTIHADVGMPSRLVAADEIHVNDRLVSRRGTALVVTYVQQVYALGLYNPHTLTGSLVVDGVLVSSYTRAVHPDIARKALWPLEMLYRVGLQRFVDTFTKSVLGGRYNSRLAKLVPSGV